ncbi:DUF1289 domain-containing protein [Psychromonas sp.]|uniref:DUF1289 domain-containing protein n=1 Tax=Psychromonas sp. TaxID=1884585 RepID=UPI00356B0C3B
MGNIKSPCIAACSLNKDKVCLGCFRSLAEISLWGQADQEQKIKILNNSKLRQKGSFVLTKVITDE